MTVSLFRSFAVMIRCVAARRGGGGYKYDVSVVDTIELLMAPLIVLDFPYSNSQPTKGGALKRL